MPITIPDTSVVRGLIDRTTIIKAKVVAIAFTSSGHILARATNKAIFGMGNKWSYHAEHMLVNKLHKLKARERYGKIFVMVLRWSRSKMDWAMAKPCSNCESILRKYGIEMVYYSDNDGNIVKHQSWKNN